jgi:hypothetical protein
MFLACSPIPSCEISSIDWQRAIFLASGCSGVVYEIAPSIVAKVAPCIKPQEAHLQSLLAREDLALPVLGYAQRVWLPQEIRQAACSPHGIRRWTAGCCTCNHSVDILLMPRVERIGTDNELDHAEVVILRARVERLCKLIYQGTWDCHAGNLAVYQGRYVALDFGDMSNTLPTS